MNKDIDERVLNGRPPEFLHQVLKNRELIFSRDDKKRVEFETSTIYKYMDFEPFYIEYDEKEEGILLA